MNKSNKNILKFKNFTFIIFGLLVSCVTTKEIKKSKSIGDIDNNSDAFLSEWYNKNYQKTDNEVIVAILDTELDIYHEDLKNNIWVNKKEIPNNKIDDDNNGYIDDINGWNFVMGKNDKSLLYGKYDSARFIYQYKDLLENNSSQNPDTLELVAKYKEAQQKLDN